MTRKPRVRLTASVLAMLERTGWIQCRRHRGAMKAVGLVRNYIPGDTPSGYTRNASYVPGWAIAICDARPRDGRDDLLFAELHEAKIQLEPLEVLIAQEPGLGPALAAGCDWREVVAMMRGKWPEAMVLTDCGDSGCLYAPTRKGMRTNGGCRCDRCPWCGASTLRGGHWEGCERSDWKRGMSRQWTKETKDAR